MMPHLKGQSLEFATHNFKLIFVLYYHQGEDIIFLSILRTINTFRVINFYDKPSDFYNCQKNTFFVIFMKNQNIETSIIIFTKDFVSLVHLPARENKLSLKN